MTLTVQTAKLLKLLIPNMQRVLLLSERADSGEVREQGNRLIIAYEVIKCDNFPEQDTLYVALRVAEFIGNNPCLFTVRNRMRG